MIVARSYAQRLREPQSRPFYSIREVALFFRVPHSTVARVYAALETEGLLVRRRSSATWLRGRAPHTQAPVHGVVTIPVFNYAYIAFTDLRLLLRQLDEELWQRHFAVNLLFFNVYEDTRPAFADRLLRHHPDYVLAIQPLAQSLPYLGQVADHGVQILMLNGEYRPSPWPQYLLSWERALTRGLAVWRRAGITDVGVLCKPDMTTASRAQLTPLLTARGLRATYHEIDSEHQAGRQLCRLPRDAQRGYLLHEAYAASNLGGMAPRELAQLMRESRGLSCRYVNVAPRLLGDTLMDFAVPDWRQVAATLAQDIATGQPIGRLFHARWRARVRATDFAQEF
jgi:NAD(P)-dependent dehydrogenase (short-subunit alcohol dehydrogenase family)